MTPLAAMPQPIHRYLGAFAARRRMAGCLRALGLACVTALGWGLACCAADRLVALPAGVRLGLLIAGAMAAVTAFIVPARRVLHRATDRIALAGFIEQARPEFRQRLQTVVSQYELPAARRSSPQIVDQLAADVACLIGAARGGGLIPWRLVLRPWLLVAALGLMVAIAAQVPRLQVSRLAARLVRPMGRVAAVTVTQVTVDPQGADVSPADPVLKIRADVRNLVGPPPVLLLSSDGQHWSRAVMSPEDPRGSGNLAVGAARYVFLVTANRDLFYHVRAGDAVSDTYRLHVMRVPRITEFHIRYQYPKYTGHAPTSVTNTDGIIENLTGSEVELTIFASEPLASADLVIDGQRLPMKVASSRAERAARFLLQHDASYSIEMVSDAGVEAVWPRTAPTPPEKNVRALPDRPPVVRIIHPDDDVRLSADDAITLRYQALDDFGLASLEAVVRLNTATAAVFPVPLNGRPVRRDGEFTFDLSDLAPHVGDVVSIGFRAGDATGQKLPSEWRRVLIVPASVGQTAHERAAELRRAAVLARGWADALARARAALGETRPTGSEPPPSQQPGGRSQPDPLSRASAALAESSDAAAALRQSLLRAVVRGPSPALFNVLAAALDDAAPQLLESGRPLAAAMARGDEVVLARLAAHLGRARETAARLKLVAQGETAAVALAELRDRRAVEAAVAMPAAGSLRERALERARQSLDATLRDLNMSRDRPNLEAQLAQFVQAAGQAMASQRRVELRTGISEWVNGLRSRAIGGSDLPARLAVAAEAESLRPDADFVSARDLQLAARAAVVVVQVMGEQRATARVRGKAVVRPPEVATLFETTFAALQFEHVGVRGTTDAATPVQRAASERAARAAAEARARMLAWIARPDLASLSPAEVGASVEEVAFEANAEAQRHSYERLVRLDEELAEMLAAASVEDAQRFRAEVGRQVALAVQLDEWIARQARLAEAPATFAAPSFSSGAAGADGFSEQWALADAIEAAVRLMEVGGGTGEPVAATQPLMLGPPRDPSDAASASTATPPTPQAAERDPLGAAAWHARAAAQVLARDDPDAPEARDARAKAEQRATVQLLRRAWLAAIHRAGVRRLESLPAYAPLFQTGFADVGDFAILSAAAPRAGGNRDWSLSLYRMLGGLGQPREAEPPGYSDALRAYFDAIAKARDERNRR